MNYFEIRQERLCGSTYAHVAILLQLNETYLSESYLCFLYVGKPVCLYVSHIQAIVFVFVYVCVMKKLC